MAAPTRTPQQDPVEGDPGIVERELKRRAPKGDPGKHKPRREAPPGESREEKPHAPSASSYRGPTRRPAMRPQRPDPNKPFC